MFKTIAAILIVLWLAGFALHLAGALIHLLLVIALLILLLDLFSRSRPVV